MTITSTDLKFFGAETPTDATYGGGPMSATIVLDGTENNVFPDIDAAARSVGRVQLRKVYAAVTSADSDAFSGAQVSVKTRPSDTAVGVAAFVYGDQTTKRSDAVTALSVTSPLGAEMVANWPYIAAGAAVVLTPVGSSTTVFTSPTALVPGALYAFENTIVGGVFTVYFFRHFAYVSTQTGSGPYTVTLSRAVPTTLAGGTINAVPLASNPTAIKCCGAVLTTATSSTSSVAVAAVEAQLVPSVSPYPAVVEGFAPAGLAALAGRVPIFRIGETVVLRNGATTETAVVSGIDYRGTLTFTASLAHSYASGSVVSSLVNLGDMIASVGPSFSQQTWTKVFSDALIGSGISANYNRVSGAITTSNLGAANERWAIVFTSPTAFKLIGEVAGQIATGTTASAFSPLNPLTSTPYFTITAAGWGTGWAAGNVLRFKTTAPRAPFWIARTISPSAPGGVDGSTFELRGTIGA